MRTIEQRRARSIRTQDVLVFSGQDFLVVSSYPVPDGQSIHMVPESGRPQSVVFPFERELEVRVVQYETPMDVMLGRLRAEWKRLTDHTGELLPMWTLSLILGLMIYSLVRR